MSITALLPSLLVWIRPASASADQHAGAVAHHWIEFPGYNCDGEGGGETDLLRDYQADVTGCKAKCSELGPRCAGFVRIESGVYDKALLHAGKCYFRAVSLTRPHPNKNFWDRRSCFAAIWGVAGGDGASSAGRGAAAAAAQPPLLALGEFYERNVCYTHKLASNGVSSVRLFQRHNGPGGRALADFRPTMFSEYGFHGKPRVRGTWVQTRADAGLSQVLTEQMCTRSPKPTAFLWATTSIGDMFHAMHHSIPLLHLWNRVRLNASTADDAELLVLPIATMGAPIHKPGFGVGSNPPLQAGGQVDLNKLRGLVMALHALGLPATQEALARLYKTYYSAGTTCVCFDEVYGGGQRFIPAPPGGSMFDPSPMTTAFAQSVRRGLGFTDTRKCQVKEQILFIERRNCSRSFSAGATDQLHRELTEVTVSNTGNNGSAAATSPRVLAIKYVDMSQLSLSEQVCAVSSSRGIAGMHGNGLTWATLLRSDLNPTFLLEIYPQTGPHPNWKEHATPKHDFQDWAHANGVLWEPHWIPTPNPGCNSRKHWIGGCENADVDVSALRSQLESIATAASSLVIST